MEEDKDVAWDRRCCGVEAAGGGEQPKTIRDVTLDTFYLETAA